MSESNTAAGLRQDGSNAAAGLKQDGSKLASKVSDAAQNVSEKAQSRADKLAPDSEPTIYEQGQQALHNASSYVQKQADQLFGNESASQAGADAAKDGNNALGKYAEQARDYASDAFSNVSGMLHKGSEEAKGAAQDVSPAEGKESYLDQAKTTASQLYDKAQETLHNATSEGAPKQ
ncbi:hypothetical protein MSPP1_000499 [Malassezia sp. CBS 17886]|nr:hypothetical protein MSPP1_000499 [Malassezia sp. CBS 17886]